MFELMVDGILVAAPDVAAVQSLCKQGKVNGETPIRKKGGEKWSRVKNLKTKPRPQFAPTATPKSAVNSRPTLIPELSDKSIDEVENRKRFWTKPRVLIAVGSTAFVALCLTMIGIISWAANHTQEEERLFLVGTWLIDSGESITSGVLGDLESKDEIKAMNREQKEFLLTAVKAKIQESLSNHTLELQRDGVAKMTVPIIKLDGPDDAEVTTGTWEFTGTGADRKIRLNLWEVESVWVPIRFDSDNQFTQIFESSTQSYTRVVRSIEATSLPSRSDGIYVCEECGRKTDNPPDVGGEVLCSSCLAYFREKNRQFDQSYSAGTATTCQWCGGHASGGKGVCESCKKKIAEEIRRMDN